MNEFSFYFGVHNNQVKLYVRTNREEKYRTKALSNLGEKECLTSTKHWNKKTKSFNTYLEDVPISSAIEDNKRLSNILYRLGIIANMPQMSNFKDIAAAYKNRDNIVCKKETTLLEFAIKYRDMWKEGKHPQQRNENSGNEDAYNSFINRLRGYWKGKEQPWKNEALEFANKPIAKIEKDDLRKWVLFLQKHNLGIDNTRFSATVIYYKHFILKDKSFAFDSIKDLKETKAKNNLNIALTNTEQKQLFDFDVNSILPRKRDKQLFKDTCILMLGTYSRPCDVVSMRIEDIYWDEEQECYMWDYCPQKLINKDNRYPVPVEPYVYEIIEKYKGNRTKGFLLPFTCNKNDNRNWKERKSGVNHITFDIGTFLRTIGSLYNWKVKKITMYTLRKTAITNLVAHMSLDDAAILAKTSIEEISKVYRDRANTARRLTPLIKKVSPLIK